MALPGVSSLKDDIKNLPPASLAPAGCMAFAGVIAKYMSNIQAGPFGTPGILVFNAPVFGSLLASMPPDPTGTAGPALMATHWMTALSASIVTPGTVLHPSFTVSVADVLTIPSAAVTCVTAPVAMALLAKGLLAAQNDKNAPEKVAQAYHDAISELQFLVIGLFLAGVVPTPLPTLCKAQ